MTYKPPVADQIFALETFADLEGLSRLPGLETAAPDMVGAILEEAGKFTGEVLAPTNQIGDVEGAVWEAGSVRIPEPIRQACQAYAAGGWAGACAPEAYGGLALPFTVGAAITEQMTAANMALSVGLMLSQGAIEALSESASPDQRATYLPKLVSGQWWGTMNLTEPQAGSDVGALRTQAVPAPDGTYRIKGQKIFISWGEHDCADNIVHLVLARIPGAPEGTKGVSLFVVPKFLPGPDGQAGRRNDVRCLSIEHKLGIHASPTCTMAFGEVDDCVGFPVGREHGGMATMFLMMNRTRINTGIQGVGVAERAYQAAATYAAERVQSAKVGTRGAPVAIIEHADVRRMLLTMRAMIDAGRALVFFTGAAIDRAAHDESEIARSMARGRADLLTPMVKTLGSEIGVSISDLAIQVFGGMGYVEETGVAQYLRDARIAPIYEGANGIQAQDLVGRKLTQDGGRPWRALVDEIEQFARLLADDATLAELAAPLSDATDRLRQNAEWLTSGEPSADDAAAGALPFLRQFALTVCGYLMARQALAAGERQAQDGPSDFLAAKAVSARYFIEQVLPQTHGLAAQARAGSGLLYALSSRQLAS